jgi:hypothetical protein
MPYDLHKHPVALRLAAPPADEAGTEELYAPISRLPHHDVRKRRTVDLQVVLNVVLELGAFRLPAASA